MSSTKRVYTKFFFASLSTTKASTSCKHRLAKKLEVSAPCMRCESRVHIFVSDAATKWGNFKSLLKIP